MHQHVSARRTLPAVIGVLALLLAAVPAMARSLPDFSGLVERQSPAVVNIATTKEGGAEAARRNMPEDHPFPDFFERFRDRPPRDFRGESLGSGFVISADGYILTNRHVVQDASEIVVRLSDRRQFVAEVIGSDERSDLALLRIDATNLPAVRIGSATELKVGEWVLAIGSPFGFEHSVTAGIVSAKGRNLPSENYVPFIQTDVAINPGNSGGPLFNLDGEVVGVNSHIYSRTGGFMGLSFSIPIELAMDVAAQLRTGGRVDRGWIGVVIQDVTRELADSFGMSRPEGALVAQVLPDSPAAAAGLQVGDIIVGFDGRDVPRSGALPPMVGRAPVGAEVPVRVIRDGDPLTLGVELGRLPDEPLGAVTPPPPAPDRFPELGLQIEPLTDEHREALGLEPDQGGVVVKSVEEGPAERAGLSAGDVITMLDRKPVNSVAEFAAAARSLDAGSTVPLLVQREVGPRFLALNVP